MGSADNQVSERRVVLHGVAVDAQVSELYQIVAAAPREERNAREPQRLFRRRGQVDAEAHEVGLSQKGRPDVFFSFLDEPYKDAAWPPHEAVAQHAKHQRHSPNLTAYAKASVSARTLQASLACLGLPGRISRRAPLAAILGRSIHEADAAAAPGDGPLLRCIDLDRV